MTALAKRAGACKGWRPMPGMLDAEGVRYCTLVDGRPHGTRQSGHAAMFRGLPDLDDPATLGCLLALVREAWGDPLAHLEPIDGGWRCWTASGEWLWGGDEAAALVAALEAAPQKDEQCAL